MSIGSTGGPLNPCKIGYISLLWGSSRSPKTLSTDPRLRTYTLNQACQTQTTVRATPLSFKAGKAYSGPQFGKKNMLLCVNFRHILANFILKKDKS